MVLSLGLTGLLAAPVLADGPTPYDGELFSLTNQDRASNGEGALAYNGTLSAIAEARAADMLARQYFSHLIPPSNTYVWPIMSADGIPWRSAGENIGWNSGYADAAAGVNTQFMNSPDHRANILGSYNELGVGSWYTDGPWNYDGSGGGPYADVDMFAQEFVLVGSSAPPPPPAPPPSSGDGGSSSGGGGGGGGGTPAPVATPTPTPVPTPTPTPKPPPPGVGSRSPKLARGLLSSTIDQVISSYLDE